MSRDTDNSLFIIRSMPRLYQQLFTGVASYETLGNRIIRQIKAAHAFRQTDKVRELSALLLNFPIKEYQLIAQYYQAWCGCREKRWDSKVLERIAEQSRVYRTRALMSLAAVQGYKQDYAAELFYFNEALKTSPNVSDFIEISKAIAVIKAKEGFHRQALIDFENVLSILKHAGPFAHYDFLNSYAVEIGEAGRKQEARNISRIVLASPFAYAYPEWQETANDLRQANRSFVVIDPSPHVPRNVLAMPAFERDGMEFPTWAGQPAQVFNYEQWKKKMGKGKKGNGRKKVDEMSDKDLFMEIISVIAQDKTTRKQLEQILNSTIKILSKPDKPEPDEPKPDDPEGA